MTTTTTTAIRPARADDAPHLAAILSDWIDGTTWMPRLHTLTATQQYVRDMIGGGGVTVLSDDVAPLGFLHETGGYISALFLAGLARGQGGGTALIDAAKARADRLNLNTFAANTGALRFYRRAGFAEIGRSTDNDENLPDVHLQWTRGETPDG